MKPYVIITTLAFCIFFFPHALIVSCSIDLIDYENQLYKIDALSISEAQSIELRGDQSVLDFNTAHSLTMPTASTMEQIKNFIRYAACYPHLKTVIFTPCIQDDTSFVRVEYQWWAVLDDLSIQGVWHDVLRYKRLYTIRQGEPFDYNEHRDCLRKIKKDLYDQGYCQAEVLDTVVDTGKQVSVSLEIVCGPVTIVKLVQHTLKENDNSELKEFCQRWVQKLTNVIFSAATIKSWTHDYTKALMSFGYYPCTLSIEPHFKNNQATLTVTTCVTGCRKFTFENTGDLNESDLLKTIFCFKEAAWSLPAQILAQALKERYQAIGFNRCTVQTIDSGSHCSFIINQGLKEPAGHAGISIDPEAAPKKEVSFGKTVVVNTSTIPDGVLLRELTYEQGQPFSHDALRSSVGAINAQGCWKQVMLAPLPVSIDNQIPIKLIVHPDKPYELRLQTGIGLQQMSKQITFSDVSYTVEGLFLVKNPFNNADMAALEFDSTHGERTLSGWYRSPWIHDWPIDALFELNYTRYKQPGLHHNQSELYTYFQKGATISALYGDCHWDAQATAGLQWLRTEKIHSYAPHYADQIIRALNYCPKINKQDDVYILLQSSATYDGLENALFPTGGFLTILSSKVLFPFNRADAHGYLQCTAEHSWYLPIKTAIMAVRFKVGHIFSPNFCAIQPALRFYLGGANSIRSYETDRCPPSGIFTDADTRFIIPQGSRSLILANIELRIPLAQRIWLALFQDSGALSNNYFADIPAQAVTGTGIGIRILTPLGPLRCDIAAKWGSRPVGHGRFCWFLSFGNAF